MPSLVTIVLSIHLLGNREILVPESVVSPDLPWIDNSDSEKMNAGERVVAALKDSDFC
jgi:hypothetical protein